MPEHKPYEPTAEDFAKAEEMMTDDERAMSAEREAFKFQESDPFDAFLGHLDQDEERRRTRPEEIKKMDARLDKLGELLAGSSVRWNLDGALNISLMAGAYIGVHKDVDISVEAEDLEKFDGLLMKHGYGLFLSSDKNENDPRGPKILERVGAERFAAADLEHRLVASVDEPAMANDTISDLNFIDVHIVTRNADGRVLGPAGAVLPEEWSKPLKIDFHGRALNLSHPAKTAFFKLHESRVYDRTDLQKLVELGGLTPKDMADIKMVFEDEFKLRRLQGEQFVSGLIANLRPGMSVEEIRDVFLADPSFAKRFRQEEFIMLYDFSERIFHLKDRTPAKITELGLAAFGALKTFDDQRAKVAELAHLVEKRGRSK